MSQPISPKYGRSTLRDVLVPRIGKDFRITFGGRSTCTDGKNIFVADLPDSADADARIQAEVSAYHEAEHVRVIQSVGAKGMFKGAKTWKDISDKFLEGMNPREKKVMCDLVNIFEDIRIDKEVCERYPGCVDKYRRSDLNTLERMAPQMDRSPLWFRATCLAIFKAHNRYFKSRCYDPTGEDKLFGDDANKAYEMLFSQHEKAIDKVTSLEAVVSLSKKILPDVIKNFTPPPPPPAPPSPPQSQPPQESDSESEDQEQESSGTGGSSKSKEDSDKEESESEGQGASDNESGEDDSEESGGSPKKDSSAEDTEEEDPPAEPSKEESSEGESTEEEQEDPPAEPPKSADSEEEEQEEADGGGDPTEEDSDPAESPEEESKEETGPAEDVPEDQDEGNSPEDTEDGEPEDKGEPEPEGEPEDEPEGESEDHAEGVGKDSTDEDESEDAEPKEGESEDGETEDTGTSPGGSDNSSEEGADASSEEGAGSPAFPGQYDASELDAKALDISATRMQSINTVAQDYYTVNPMVKDKHVDAPILNGGTDWLTLGRPYFGGIEAKIRHILLDAKAPKVIDSLPKGKHLDTRHLYRKDDYKLGKQPTIWETRLRGTNIDTALHISVDGSGSMNSRRWLTQMAILTALCNLLDTCSVKYTTVEWSLDGHRVATAENIHQRVTAVNYRRFSQWGERLNPHRIPDYPLGGYTPTADIIPVGLEELSARSEVRKALVMFTDGEPYYNEGYSGGPVTSAAVAFAEEQMNRARALGFKTFGFGIDIVEGSSEDRVMTQLFKGGWVRLDFSMDPGYIATIIVEKLKEAFQ